MTKKNKTLDKEKLKLKNINQKQNLSENGITLIALVITIVILLILVGVTLRIAINQGLLDHTNKSALATKRAQVSETLSMMLTEQQMSNTTGTAEEIVEATRKEAYSSEELKKMGKKVTVNPETSTEEDGKTVDVYFYVQVDEDVYKVDMAGVNFIGEEGKFPPVIIDEITHTTNSITIKIKTSRNVGGKIEIFQKIKNDEESDYTLIKTGTDNEAIELEHIISGLKQDETYSIKIVATATNEQTAEVIRDVTTGSVPSLTEGDITFTYSINGENIEKETWTNQDVTVTASTDLEGYELQTSTDAENWSSNDSQTFSKNGTMYVALFDGINYGGTATADIKNIDKSQPKDITPNISVVNNQVVIDATAADDEAATTDYEKSGISTVSFIEDGAETVASNKKYTYKNIKTENSIVQLRIVDNAGNERTKDININTYIGVVTFNSNGGTGTMNNIIAMKNTNVQLPTNTFANGTKKFVNWSITSDGNGTTYTNNQTITVTGNITLYAIWKNSINYGTSTSTSYSTLYAGVGKGTAIDDKDNDKYSGNFKNIGELVNLFRSYDSKGTTERLWLLFP